MDAVFVDSIEAVDPGDWNRLAGADNPFLRHEFLLALERQGCVGRDTGWQPQHLLLRERGVLRAGMPLYRKFDSWGEFVFDWAWAHAYRQAGRSYYPKLVAAVPYSPVSGPRLLCGPDAHSPWPEAAARLRGLAEESGMSSLHVLFPAAEELPGLAASGLALRKDCQFHWHNRAYGDFDDFLAGFTSKKRKNTRRERRKVHEAGIRLERRYGAELDASEWERVYELHALSFLRRGRPPYLTLDFFREIGRTLGESVLAVIARRHGEPVAAAIFLLGREVLYGRYWGCREYHDALHFETCYYQGIELCIEQGLARFEPGTQGEHKLSRGFEPSATWSAHWLADPRFHAAVSRYIAEETAQVDAYMHAVQSELPFRRDPAASAQ
jgi:predicted N-acyltransferase